NIEFLGRIDHMIKIRGFRVETGEIESQLLNHPGIIESVVVAKTEDTGNKYLCAYVTAARGDHKPDTAVLREFLSGILPGYMVPSYFTFLEQIPVTTAGKVDRSALPDPQLKESAVYIRPANPVEEKLAGIWADVLGIEESRIGSDSHFFELGGHSLKVIRLVSQIHRKMHIKCLYRDIFNALTLGELAKCLRKKERVGYISITPA
ncbi:MAG: hypothetical protein GY940_40715, partial [bacterium]|nr:hypothetical protein [bacterium]